MLLLLQTGAACDPAQTCHLHSVFYLSTFVPITQFQSGCCWASLIHSLGNYGCKLKLWISVYSLYSLDQCPTWWPHFDITYLWVHSKILLCMKVKEYSCLRLCMLFLIIIFKRIIISWKNIFIVFFFKTHLWPQVWLWPQGWITLHWS